MISKLYNTMLFSTVSAGKTNNHSTFSNSCLSSPSSNKNHDRFVFSDQSEHLQISGASLRQSSRSVAQKTQARNIPSMLAAKIAGLKTNDTGSPIINSKFDYEAYNSAKLKIQNNPKKSIIVKNTVIVKPVAIVTAFLLPEPHVPLFFCYRS